MDGKNKIVLAANLPCYHEICSIFLDKPGNRLFFAGPKIAYIDLSSMKTFTLLAHLSNSVASLTMLNNTLYWTAYGHAKLAGALYKAKATNESEAKIIADGLPRSSQIHAYNSLAFTHPGNSYILMITSAWVI